MSVCQIISNYISCLRHFFFRLVFISTDIISLPGYFSIALIRVFNISSNLCPVWDQDSGKSNNPTRTCHVRDNISDNGTTRCHDFVPSEKRYRRVTYQHDDYFLKRPSFHQYKELGDYSVCGLLRFFIKVYNTTDKRIIAAPM